MRELIFIGTLHAGITPPKELVEILESLEPDQLLLEMVELDVKRNCIAKYPSEMKAAYRWARKKGIPVNGFDKKLSVFQPKSRKENAKVIEEQKSLIRGRSWKDFNKEAFNRRLYTDSYFELVDETKYKLREIAMVRNIKKRIFKMGRIVVITGCGHLDHFERAFVKASFPLRGKNEKS